VDEKFREEAYKKMTKVFLEHFPWIPVIQPYEDYGLQSTWSGRRTRSSSSRSVASTVPPGPEPGAGPGRGGSAGPAALRAFLVFLAGRLGRALVALWLVSTVVFVVMRLSGDPVPLLLPPDAPRSEFARVRAELGLDRPLPVQYAVFLGSVLRGDFGQSIRVKSPALDVVVERLPATVELGLTAFGLAILVAIPSASCPPRRNTAIDHAAMSLALVSQSAPTFFLGILFILLVSVKASSCPRRSRRGGARAAVGDLGLFAMASVARLTPRRVGLTPTTSAPPAPGRGPGLVVAKR
jgi:peptide/nickel transport system permease protein